MFFLSYVNEHVYILDSFFRLVLLKTRNWLDKPVCFTHTIVLLIYVNENIYLLGNLPFFKIHVNHFMAQDHSPCANVISKYMLWVRGLVPLWVLRHFFSLVDFPGGSEGKASANNMGDLGSIPGLGRSFGEGNDNQLQYSCLEKSHGWRRLVGYCPWVRKESDTTEQLH